MSSLKRLTTKLNIIPDSDVPKDENQFGAGFVNAMRTGRMALPLGFTVTIQEIPFSDKKNDPDSYLSSKEKLDDLTKQDFVMWYANKLIGHCW